MVRRSKPEKAPAQEIEFDYIKSNFFRVIRADGAHGGVAPTGAIHMALFSERRPIPQKTFNAIAPDGTLGAEILEKREARKAIIREVEVDVVLEIGQAIALSEWLKRQIDQYATLTGIALKPATEIDHAQLPQREPNGRKRK